MTRLVTSWFPTTRTSDLEVGKPAPDWFEGWVKCCSYSPCYQGKHPFLNFSHLLQFVFSVVLKVSSVSNVDLAEFMTSYNAKIKLNVANDIHISSSCNWHVWSKVIMLLCFAFHQLLDYLINLPHIAFTRKKCWSCNRKCYPDLISIRLKKNHFWDSVAWSFQAPALTALDMRACDFNERCVPILGRALKLGSPLTVLHLENTYLAGRSLTILGKLTGLLCIASCNATLFHLILQERSCLCISVSLKGIQTHCDAEVNHSMLIV